jgi:SsrA-binding protein
MLVNRKARFNYEIIRTVEAGLQLVGTEVKSLRAGKVSFTDAFVINRDGELYLSNMRIDPWTNAREQHEPSRPRKLLLRKREIATLLGEMSAKGLSVVPTKVYLKNGLFKVELGVGRGKKLYDKRETIKARDIERRLRNLA